MTARPLLALQPVIETERLVLRGFAAEDFDAYAALYADEAASRFIGGPDERDAVWRRFAGNIGHVPLRGYGPFAVTLKDGTWIGFAGPWFPLGKPGREIMWALAPAYHGRGYAFEAASRLLTHAWQDLGWTQAISIISPQNAPSRRLAERLGAVAGERWIDGRGDETILYRHDLTARAAQSSTTSPG